MSREEAIGNLIHAIRWNDRPKKEAMEMAIQALEQEPCEDAVSRKALISHIENQSREWGEDYDAQQILGDIEDMPSVKPQTGHWRHYEGMLTCSECGAEFYDDIMEYCGDDAPKCCPDCGARMEVEQNG